MTRLTAFLFAFAGASVTVAGAAVSACGGSTVPIGRDVPLDGSLCDAGQATCSNGIEAGPSLPCTAGQTIDCASGDPSTHVCGDSLQKGSCVDGHLACPAGLMPLSECWCSAVAPCPPGQTMGACTPSGWACDLPDAGSLPCGYGPDTPPVYASLPKFSFAKEFAPCASASDCNCGLSCLSDPVLSNSNFFGTAGLPDAGPGYCEQSCKTTADCSDPGTVCRNSACTVNFCAIGADGGITAGALGKSCDADGQPGTCQVVYENDNYPIAFGICMQSGSSTGACTRGAGRGQPGAICAQGSLCLGNTFQYGMMSDPTNPMNLFCGQLDAGGPPFCEQVCDTTAPNSCPSGTGCAPWAPEYPQGSCYPDTLTFGLCR